MALPIAGSQEADAIPNNLLVGDPPATSNARRGLWTSYARKSSGDASAVSTRVSPKRDEESGDVSQAQFHAFTDTWHWADAEPTYRDFLNTCPLVEAVTIMGGYRTFLRTSPMMEYYDSIHRQKAKAPLGGKRNAAAEQWAKATDSAPKTQPAGGSPPGMG